MAAKLSALSRILGRIAIYLRGLLVFFTANGMTQNKMHIKMKINTATYISPKNNQYEKEIAAAM
jgi:hypothetical protein